MSRMDYFWSRLFKMDWRSLWKTTGILKQRSGKSRIWLMRDMLKWPRNITPDMLIIKSLRCIS